MKQLSSADFRKVYPSLTEPTLITAHGQPMATYYPWGTEPLEATESASQVEVDPEPTRMTIRPVKGPVRRLVATHKRVLDPLDARRRESDRYDEFQPRVWQRKA